MYILNPDKEHVELILEQIKKRNGHCPCAIQENEDTLCQCKEFRETGNCQCLLYVEES